MYYAIAAENSMLVALGDLASEQTKITASTLEELTHILNYADSHPNARIGYYASDMILHIHSGG